jgi:signal peptide peptidase SppA
MADLKTTVEVSVVGERVRGWLAGHVWALDVSRLEVYAPRALEQWATVLEAGDPAGRAIAATVLEARGRAAVDEADDGTRIAGALAIVPVHGFLSARPSLSSLFFGGTALSDLRRTFQALKTMPRVREVYLEVDSPGGSVYGVHETWLAIRELDAVKPVTALVTGLAASAGYWLASAARRVLITPSGDAGSIGVYGVHEDRTQFFAAKGIVHTVIAAGTHKAETLEVQALTDGAKGRLQRLVDAKYAQFVADVAVGRKTTPEAVRQGYGEGGVLCAEDALAARLVDAIEPTDVTYDRAARLSADAARGVELAALLATVETLT